MAARYPCAACKKVVGNEARIECAICLQWLHSCCAGLSNILLAELGRWKDPYMCEGCRTDYYNYHLSLNKIASAADLSRAQGDFQILQQERTIQAARMPPVQLIFEREMHNVDFLSHAASWPLLVTKSLRSLNHTY